MNMTLMRLQHREDGIFSELLEPEGEHFCFTLEHAYAQNGSGFQPKIPPGQYECIRGLHTLAGHPQPFQTFEITGVLNHIGLLFHPGNFNNDSEGCILLGESIVPAGNNGMQIIDNSVKTFRRFLEAQGEAGSFFLTVVEAPPALSLAG